MERHIALSGIIPPARQAPPCNRASRPGSAWILCPLRTPEIVPFRPFSSQRRAMEGRKDGLQRQWPKLCHNLSSCRHFSWFVLPPARPGKMKGGERVEDHLDKDVGRGSPGSENCNLGQAFFFLFFFFSRFARNPTAGNRFCVFNV